ncbi:alpha-2-macroglobulin family protein [Microvirga brassicacearum]|uniref:Alpha-2-macroglobulin family protein n=1 Tax=Microvirga brassicacearum TaxID=2580413 RepID=A0A5N3P8G6_9HYPH|nr:alpha-2-macroglobulin [Microvirga brassicacearum]KAB0266010.1 alpha-2-macroglobulin family protein [Microvirga brassicacearum]
MVTQLLRAVLVAATLCWGIVGVQAQSQKSFVREDLASESVRLQQSLRTETAPFAGGKPAAQLRREGQSFLSQRLPKQALNSFGAAIAIEPGNSANWAAFAAAALAVDPGNDWQERYKLQERQAVAAYTAYQRATNPADEASALALLGQIYANQQSWRPSLNAYAASLKLQDNAAVRATYEQLRAEHGFRVTDFKIDSDSASPRVCFQFSEPLAGGKVDFTPFVALSGSATAAVTAEGSQLCVDGLKHSQRYAVVLRQGLPSAVGEALLQSYDSEIYVRDRSPQARFTGRNYVLPSTGQEGIPVVSVNTSKVDVEVYRIGDRNLLPTVRSDDFLGQITRYSAAEIAREKGLKIWNGTLDTASELNRDVVTAFPVIDAVGKLEPGVYVMTAKPNDGSPSDNESTESYDNIATQWFVVSDLGLTAFTGKGGVQVLVRSLATADPRPDVEVRLVARNNEILAVKKTDSAGVAIFDPGLARGEGGLAPGILVASAGSDYGFVDLGSAAFDLTDRGVKGRPASGAVDAFLYTERGVYRTGETVALTALLRDVKGVAVPGVPLTIVVGRPDGVEYRRALVEDQGLGGRALSIPILPGSLRGTWRVAAYTDPKGPSIGDATFLVEDYVPERLEVNLSPQAEALHAGRPAPIDLSARYLYGAPGSGLDVSGEVTVAASAVSGIKGIDGYVVGLDDEPVESSTVEIEQAATTDAQGRASLQIPVQDVSTPRPTEARITLRVSEAGGRAVERSVTLPILPKGPVVAVRKNFAGQLGEGANATFDVVLANPDGTRIANRNVVWSLYKIERRYQWYNSDGRWGYEPVKSTRRMSDGRVDVGTAEAARISAPVEWGTYRLDISAADLGETAQTSVSFTVGWSGDQTADTPDLLDMTLDKASYRSGDMMKVRLNPRFAGKATLAVVSDRMHHIRVVDVAAGGTDVTVPVQADWGPGAYLVAIAHRPLDQAARRMPGRALGTAWFAIDQEARSLTVSLNAPEKIRPRGTLALPIKVAGLDPDGEARITVAAVDVGILNLTHYETPDPKSYFFGQRQLSAELRDLYGYLIDGMQGTRGAIRSGGDMEPKPLDGIPPTQEPLARFSGVVKVGADGTANVEFDMPAFNGTVRVMAVAWTKNRVGSASADVIVRDPVVLAGTLPRFLSVGDRSRFFMQIDNVEGAAGEYTLDLNVSGPVIVGADALRSIVKLDAKAKTQVAIPVTAGGRGRAVVDVTLRGPGLAAISQRFTVAIQPGTGAIARRTIRPLDPGARLTVSQDLVADILSQTGVVAVSVSPRASLDVPGLLQALDRYPYGCTEQTISRALPLLYVNKLAEEEKLSLDESADERVRGAIERVLARQDSNGSFGLWSVGGDDLWLDAYTTDFLTRAREKGFVVPAVAFNLALDRLRNFVANTTQVEDDGSNLAYAAYVLARNGRPVMGDLRYLADTKFAEFGSPLARAQIAAALALLGDRARAQKAFASATELLTTEKDDGSYRGDYGSRLRDGAGLLTLASETDNSADLVQRVGQVIDQERGNRRTSTQEQAWLVLAAQAVARDAEAMALTIDGTAHKGAFYHAYRDQTLAPAPVTLANAGSAPVQAVITVTGSPIEPQPAISSGYAVERAYYKLDGTQVQPSRVQQNDRLVVVLKITESEAKQARVLLVDRLPAGFEIDNPKLADSDTVKGLPWLKRDVEPAHTEFRDDRFVAAFDREPEQAAFFSIAYMVRAVSPGRYVHPAAQVEDMYRPERFGRTDFGMVEVVQVRP